MPTPDLVVIGASAGGAEALHTVLSALPADFPAAICLVVHVPPGMHRSYLPHMLRRAVRLPVEEAVDGEPVESGRVYIAPPDRHLVVRDGHLHLTRGPRENDQRPAIDPLFRSAAQGRGPTTVGVVLSGALDDGTAGLLAIERAGGITVVQDPEDALYPGMPRSALECVDVQHVAPAGQLAPLLVRLVSEESGRRGPGDLELPIPDRSRDRRSEYSCPECHGVLWELEDGELLQFHCHTGHVYTADSLLTGQDRDTEETLYAALRSLEERASLADRLAQRARERGAEWRVDRYATEAERVRTQVGTVRSLLRRGAHSESSS